jgi:uncharacterized protein (TIGR02300 family)
VAKAEWGLKRLCPHCNTRYYDMKKHPPVCPSCGTIFDPETLAKARRGAKADAKKTQAAPEEVIDDLPVADGEAEDAVIEDADELADEAVEEVVEVAEDERDR